MPTVAHYRCSKCQQLVTHEIVHVSDDMKHDAHLVKMFTEKNIHVLKDNNINIRKIIEFKDQAPSQYKNKTAFTYLAHSDIPTQKSYFGVRHGKSSCDACTGRVKEGVIRLVQSGEAVVNSAETFYKTCVEHLQKPMEKSDKCQHYMLTFELHKKVCRRSKTVKWSGQVKFYTFGNSPVAALDAFRGQCLARTQFVQQDGQPLTWPKRKQLMPI